MKLTFKLLLLIFLISPALANWFWKPAVAARIKMDTIISENNITFDESLTFNFDLMPPTLDLNPEYIHVEFNDTSSGALISTAWQAMDDLNYGISILFSKKCIELYSDHADKIQASLEKPADKSKLAAYQALNDVGQPYFILGEIFYKTGHYEPSLRAYNTCIQKYKYAQVF